MWRTVKLGDVCEIQPKKSAVKKQLTDSDLVSFIGMDILGIKEKYTKPVQNKYVSEVYSQYTYFAENDVLLAKITPCFENGKLGIAKGLTNQVGFGSSEFVVYRCSVEILPDYLYYFLRSDLFRARGIASMSGAVGHKRIDKEYLTNCCLQLPPLAEQQRIVEKLDRAFSEIDKAIDLVNKSVEQSEKFTEEVVRSNFLNNGKTRKKIFSDVCTLQRGFDLPTRLRKPGTYPLYSANGVTDYIDDYKVTAPAVVTGRSGTIGAVHFSDKNIWALNTALYVRDFKGNFPKYIYYFLKSFDLKKYASGAGVPTLNRNVLAEEDVFLEDDFEKQIAISNRLDNLLDICTHLISKQRAVVQCYVELKSSILKQALQPPQQ